MEPFFEKLSEGGQSWRKLPLQYSSSGLTDVLFAFGLVLHVRLCGARGVSIDPAYKNQGGDLNKKTSSPF